MREAGARSARLSVECVVGQAGDAENGLVDAVAFEAAVAEDPLALHAGQGVLHDGVNSLVGALVFLLPGREFLAFGTAVRDDESGARVTAVGDGHRLADGVLGAGFLPAAGVVPVAGQGAADHDDQAGVGVDDELVGGGVPVILLTFEA